jgi:poly(A) polymerase
MVPKTLLSLIENSEYLKTVSDLYSSNGYEFYLVGGAVRDGILDIETTDFDFTTNASPEESIDLLNNNGYKTTEIGRAFGTIELQIDNNSLHITTYRKDTYENSSRNPSIESATDLETDLSRRDFTINSIAYSIDANELIDPFNGLKDLAAGVIRTPDDPIISFSDDPLRMLRVCRFISTHGFSPDNETYVAMRDNTERIKIVSTERIRDEISKLLIGKNPSLGLRTFVESGLSSYTIPELNALKIEVDPNHHHKDVYEHTLTVVDNVSPTLIRRLGALFHDIAKPNTKGIENGKVHFRHHEVVGAKMTKRILQELKYDKKTIKNVARLVELHLRPHTFKMGWTDSAVRRYIVDAGEVLDDLNNLVRADVTTKNKQKAQEIYDKLDEMENKIKEVLEKEEMSKLRPPITGDEIMEIFNLEPGPKVGLIMKALYEQRINEGEVSKEDAIKLAGDIFKEL